MEDTFITIIQHFVYKEDTSAPDKRTFVEDLYIFLKLIFILFYSISNSVCFVSLPKKITANTPMTMATQKIATIIPKSYPAVNNHPTRSGPKIPPTRPTAVAIPAPVPRMTNGYCSGV